MVSSRVIGVSFRRRIRRDHTDDKGLQRYARVEHVKSSAIDLEAAIFIAEPALKRSEPPRHMRLVPVTGSETTSSDPDMVGWNGLPAELKALTLSFAIAAAQQKPKAHHLASYAVVCRDWQDAVEPANFASLRQKPKAHHLASYAVVCRDWQDAVEPANFASLRVTAADLADFVSLVVGPRRRYLKHLLLGIELPKYNKKKARVPETDDEQTDNDIAFSTTILGLFHELAAWKVDETHGLEVELCARSPSDTLAMSGAAGITEEGESRYFDSHLDFSFIDTGWIGQHGLPSVDVITKLSILRRCWRNIDSMAVLTLVSSLPRLAEVRYEPFQQFDDGAQEVIDMDRARFLPFWPETIRRLSLFEHFDHPEDEPQQRLHDSADEGEPRTCAALAITIARRSLQLEELAVSFMADARHFFQPFFEVARANAAADLHVVPELTLPRYEGMFKFIHTNLWTREMVLHGVSSLEVLRNKTLLPPAQLKLK
ncbi:hypothetical protein VdG1_07235 [Verticillium dahliae VDG1]|nr:hypothetical protein VdG1_07235 [Verticillium dahliae VDG1]